MDDGAPAITLRKGDATHARILDEATRLAALRGLSAVSLADVATSAGLSKSGLFKHFDSKEAMQHEVLHRAWDRFVGYIWEPVAHLPPGRPRLEAVFDRWIGWGTDARPEGGCPINAMAIELDDQPGPLREAMRERQFAWRSRLVADFKALRDPPSPDDEAWQAVFEMKGYVLALGEASRLLEDGRAKDQARRAMANLLDRIEQGR
ncbi:TetR/AcrR family transcriptional regulator [Caulobacter sp. KR2-114]|uniref:TetR/AcrR family transcriptional regulator n=1 Tax=Caulobacter sp. KR2-114 TaxID=3400912 RepID=UPI003BFE4BAE